jgi:hypothetical protein
MRERSGEFSTRESNRQGPGRRRFLQARSGKRTRPRRESRAWSSLSGCNIPRLARTPITVAGRVRSPELGPYVSRFCCATKLVPINFVVKFAGVSTVLMFLIMCAAVCSGQTPPAGASGIEGVITISPANPGPTRADTAGSMPLASATFTVENKNGEVASFITDDQGRFRVSLAPGHYKISLKGRKSSIGRFGPFEADVAPGKMAYVQWNCDSGIR